MVPLLIVSGAVLLICAALMGSFMADGEYVATVITGALSLFMLFMFFCISVSYTTDTIVEDMLICPSCGEVYSTESTYCQSDGTKLITVFSTRER